VGQAVALRFDPAQIHLFAAEDNGARLNLDAPPAAVIPMRSK
jgi:hypothetical protein